MHYVGSTPVSADYFGRFVEEIRGRLAADEGEPPFVGIMSQGTSGDLMWMDYGRPARPINSQDYAAELSKIALSRGQRVISPWAGVVAKSPVHLKLMHSLLMSASGQV